MFDTVSVPAGATAGILLIHGGTGRGDHERERGARLLELGYAVHAPDLFGGPPTREAIVALSRDPSELRRRVVAAWSMLAAAVPITFAVGITRGARTDRDRSAIASAGSPHSSSLAPVPPCAPWSRSTAGWPRRRGPNGSPRACSPCAARPTRSVRLPSAPRSRPR